MGKKRGGQLVSRLTRDVFGAHMHSSKSSLAARGLTGLGLQYIGCIVFFVCLFLLCMMEEGEIWDMATAWVERDQDTLSRARILTLTEEEAEERKS